MRSLHSMLGTALATALLAAGCASGRSDEPVIKDNLQQVSARVEAVDPATRMVRLNAGQGPVDVEVSRDVRNFDQIRVGDNVQVSYYTGIAAQIRKKGDPAAGPSDEVVTARSDPGAKPGAAVGRNISTTVTIESVDTSFNTVTFTRPDGAVKVVSVESPEGQKFIKTLRKGDQVDVTYTEAVAVEVVPGK